MTGVGRITRSGAKRAMSFKNKEKLTRVSDNESNVYKKPSNYIPTVSPVNTIGSPDSSDAEYSGFGKHSDRNEGSDIDPAGEEFTYSKIYSPRASPTSMSPIQMEEVKERGATKPEWLNPGCFAGKTWEEAVDMLTQILSDFDFESNNVHFVSGLIANIKSHNYLPDTDELRCKIISYLTEHTS